jgi:hypothetical protein
MTTYTHILDLAKEAEPPADGILSRTIFQANLKHSIKAKTPVVMLLVLLK